MSFSSPFLSKLHKWPLPARHTIILIFVLITNLLLLVEVSGSADDGGGSRSVISSFAKRGKSNNNGGFPKYRIQRPTRRADSVIATSIEKPPVVTSELDKLNQTVDETGVTVSPSSLSLSSLSSVSSERRNEGGRSNSFFSWFDKLRGLKSAFSRLSNAMSEVEGRGYHEHSFMDGAMVPMTFLLMAAFIMDILQRLFPLPYAKFVDDYAHSAFLGHHHGHHHVHARQGSPTVTASPLDNLTPQLEVKTPIGSLGVTTNDKHKEAVLNHIFGRSNQGNPGIGINGGGTLLPENSYYSIPTTVDTPTDPVADLLYLTNYNNAQQKLQLQQQQQQQEQLFQLQDGQQFQFQQQGLESQQQQGLDQSQQQQQDGQQLQEQLLNLNIQQQALQDDGQQQQQDGQQQLEQQLAVQKQREEEAENSVSGNNVDSDGNPLARFDYVDYYSRFDGNGQPWKKKKRSTHKAANKS